MSNKNIYKKTKLINCVAHNRSIRAEKYELIVVVKHTSPIKNHHKTHENTQKLKILSTV